MLYVLRIILQLYYTMYMKSRRVERLLSIKDPIKIIIKQTKNLIMNDMIRTKKRLLAFENKLRDCVFRADQTEQNLKKSLRDHDTYLVIIKH